MNYIKILFLISVLFANKDDLRAYNDASFTSSQARLTRCEAVSTAIKTEACNPALIGSTCAAPPPATTGAAKENAAIGLTAGTDCTGSIGAESTVCKTTTANNTDCYASAEESVESDYTACVHTPPCVPPMLSAPSCQAACNAKAQKILAKIKAGNIEDKTSLAAYLPIAAAALSQLMSLMSSSKKSKDQMDNKSNLGLDPSLGNSALNTGATGSQNGDAIKKFVDPNNTNNSSGNIPTDKISSDGKFINSGLNGDLSGGANGNLNSGSLGNNTASNGTNNVGSSNAADKLTIKNCTGKDCTLVDKKQTQTNSDSLSNQSLKSANENSFTTPASDLKSQSSSSSSGLGLNTAGGSTTSGNSNTDNTGKAKKNEVSSNTLGSTKNSSDDVTGGGSGYFSNQSGGSNDSSNPTSRSVSPTSIANRTIASSLSPVPILAAANISSKNSNLFDRIHERYHFECANGKTTINIECPK